MTLIASGLLNQEDAAAFLGLKPATLRMWRFKGVGPAYRKLGHAVRYHIDDLKAFVESGKRHSTSETAAA